MVQGGGNSRGSRSCQGQTVQKTPFLRLSLSLSRHQTQEAASQGETQIMTLRPGSDLVRFPRYVCEYEDGGTDVFACPDATLEQGPKLAMLRLVANEWQADGFLRPGTIVAIRPNPLRR
jgi:hypothetical protein